MLDTRMRPVIDPILDRLGRQIARTGVSANTITLVGFSLGMLALPCIISGHTGVALIFIMLNRVLDGLDGAVARINGVTDIGGFLDIVCDFIFYAGTVFAFSFYAPTYGFWAAFLIFSYIGATSSFLAYSIIAAKRKITTHSHGVKSIYYLGGLSEGSETIIAMVAMCLMPDAFPFVCIAYGTMCWLTTFGRFARAWVDFRPIAS